MQAPCSFLQAKAYTTKTLRTLIYTVDKAEKKKTIGGYRPGRRFKKKKKRVNVLRAILPA